MCARPSARPREGAGPTASVWVSGGPLRRLLLGVAGGAGQRLVVLAGDEAVDGAVSLHPGVCRRVEGGDLVGGGGLVVDADVRLEGVVAGVGDLGIEVVVGGGRRVLLVVDVGVVESFLKAFQRYSICHLQ